MPKQFAITDIHGCNLTFKALLDQIQLSPSDELFLLGDYIDRGPDSKGVIDTILKLKADGYRVRCLKGNHEDALIKSRTDGQMLRNWLNWGGQETMESFGVHYFEIDKIPQQYIDFMNDCEYFIEEEEYLLVHAGLNFLQQDPLNGLHDMLWIRNWYSQINHQWLDNRIVLHGHTPINRIPLLEQHDRLAKNQYLDLDNGCVYASRPQMGQLVAFNMTDRTLSFQKNIELIKLY